MEAVAVLMAIGSAWSKDDESGCGDISDGNRAVCGNAGSIEKVCRQSDSDYEAEPE